MKALIINNEVVRRFLEVPKFLNEFMNVQRPDLLNEQELAERGISIVEIDGPVCDFEVEELQNERYDETLNKVVYDVVDLPIDLDEIRKQKHEEFDNIIYSEMTPAVMYAVIEKLALGDPIPAELIATLTSLRAREAQVDAEIDTITDPKELKKYKFNPVEIKAGKEALKSARKL